MEDPFERVRSPAGPPSQIGGWTAVVIALLIAGSIAISILGRL